jgi:hypothetical protein
LITSFLLYYYKGFTSFYLGDSALLKNFKILPFGAYPFLRLDEKLFIRQCRVETYAASGPGGQKRNRTYSAVRITHFETDISAIAEESRSQTENKLKALKRVKIAIALNIRKDQTSSLFKMPDEIADIFRIDRPLQINRKNPLYPLFCATVLDSIYLAQGSISSASKILNTTTGKLNKVLSRDKDFFCAANRLRDHFHLKPLKITLS